MQGLEDFQPRSKTPQVYRDICCLFNTFGDTLVHHLQNSLLRSESSGKKLGRLDQTFLFHEQLNREGAWELVKFNF